MSRRCESCGNSGFETLICPVCKSNLTVNVDQNGNPTSTSTGTSTGGSKGSSVQSTELGE